MANDDYSEITPFDPNFNNKLALRAAISKGRLAAKSQRKKEMLEHIARRKRDPSYQMGDTLASLGAGFSAILEGAGTIQGAVTGDMDNWLRNTGQENREWYNERKGLLTPFWEGRRAEDIRNADGTLGKANAAIWATIDNPRLFSNFIVEQLPNLAAGGAIGKGVGAAAKGVNALRGVTSATAAATAAGRGGAIGSSALHGADVASGTYDSLIGLGDDVWDANPEFRKLAQVVGREEAKKQIATNRTRAALATATLASLVTQKVVPGGDVLEKTLAGAGKKSGMGVIGSTVVGGAAEGAQEVLEEGTGNVIGNVAVQSVDESQELTEGLGESIGLGLLGGATTGGGIGVMKGVANELADAAQDGPAAEQVVSPDLNTEKSRENIVSAITTGDESPLLNPEDKESYSPIHAMQANDVISTDRERRLAEGEEAPRSAEDIRARSNRILKAQEEHIASLENSLAEETDEAAKATLKRDLGIANNALKATRSSAEVINNRLAKEAAPAPEEKETMLEKIETAESAEEVTEEKERVLKLAMRTPDEFSDEDLSRLGQSQVLAQEERDYVGAVQQTRKDLEKVKQANNANKTLKQVNSEVLNGGEGFKGVSQYVQDASIALSDGDTATAETELEKLRAFYVNRDKKLAAVSEAQNLVESTGKPQFVKMDSATKEWSISDKIPKGKDHGGWVAYKSDKGKAATQKMVDVLSTEKAVLTSAGKQVGSAIGLVKGTQPTTQSTPEVTPTETAATTPTASAEPTVEAAPQVQAETVEAPSEIVIPEAVKGGLNTPELVAQYNARNTKIAEVNKGKVVTLNYGGRNPLDFKATFTGKVEQVGGSPSAPITQLQFKTNTGKIVTAVEADIVSGDYINKSSEAVADVATPTQETNTSSLQERAQKSKDTPAPKSSEPNKAAQSAQPAAEKSTEPAKLAQKSVTAPTTSSKEAKEIAKGFTDEALAKLRGAYTKINEEYKALLDRFTELSARSMDVGTTANEALADAREMARDSERLSTLGRQVDSMRIAVGTNNDDVIDIYNRLLNKALSEEEEAARDFPVTQKEFDNRVEHEKRIKVITEQDLFSVVDPAEGKKKIAGLVKTWMRRQAKFTLDSYMPSPRAAYEAKQLMDIWGVDFPSEFSEAEEAFNAAVNYQIELIDMAKVAYDKATAESSKRTTLEEQIWLVEQSDPKFRTSTVGDWVSTKAPAPNPPQQADKPAEKPKAPVESQAVPVSTPNTSSQPTQENTVAESSTLEQAPVTTETVVSADSPIESAENQTTDSSVEEQVETSPKRSGTIPQEDFKAANLVKEYFVRKKGSLTSKALNPLTAVKNFITSLFTPEGDVDVNRLGDFLVSDENGTPQQGDAFFTFLRFHEEFKKAFKQSIEQGKKSDLYRYEDVAKFLIDETTGEVSENDITAMALAAFTYLGENGSTMELHARKQVKKMLNIDKEGHLPNSIYEELKNIGTRSNQVVPDLGKRAAQAAGLKAHRGAPEDTQVKLELSLGQHILAVLTHSDIVVEKQHNTVSLAFPLNEENKKKLLGANTSVLKQPQNFVSVNPDSDWLQTIVSSSKGSQSFLNKLFFIESGDTPPADVAADFVQKIVKNGVTRIPAKQAEAYDKYGKEAWAPRVDMAQISNVLDRSTVDAVAGIVRPTEDKPALRRNVNSIEARNRGIERGIDNFWGWYSPEEDQEFYLTPVVTKQQRTNNKSNVLNPQTDKYVRHMVTKKEWLTEVDVVNPSSKSQRLFKVAVAQGMGIDTDTRYQLDVIRELEEMTFTPEFRAAIDAIIAGFDAGLDENGVQKKLNQAQQEAIATMVEIGGARQHTLDALVTYARFENTQERQQFFTDIMYEIDGVNNGPALAQVGLGAVTIEQAEAFGFFGDGNDSSIADRKAQNKKDLYEQVAESMVNNTGLLAVEESQRAHAVLSIVGSDPKSTRSFVKQPLTALIFGSGLNKAINSMGASFLETFYDKYEKALQEGNYATAESLINNLNKVADPSGKTQLVRVPRNPWNLDLSSTEEAAILKAFSNSIGVAMKDTLNNRFESFLSTRNTLNQVAQAAWARYNAAYEFLVKDFYKKGIKDGSIPSKKYHKEKSAPKIDVALQALPPETVKRIEDILSPLQPTMHTPLSRLSGDISAGIYLGKHAYTTAVGTEAEHAYASAAVPGVPGKLIKVGQQSPTSKKYYTTTGKRIALTEPGAGPVIGATHATESAIMTLTVAEQPVLNVHDAAGTGVGQMVDTATTLNRNTFRMLAGYSLPMEMTSALNRSFLAGDKLSGQYEGLSEAINSATIKVWEFNPNTFKFKEANVPITKEMEGAWTKEAAEATVSKLKFLQEVTVVDQYAFPPIDKNGEGAGSYVVTEQDKKNLAAEQKRIEGFLETRFVENTNSDALAAVPPIADKDDATESTPVPTRVTPEQAETNTEWGRVGTPGVPSDPDLVKLVETITQRKGNAKQLAKQAAKQVGKTNAYLGKLLQTLSTHVSEQIPVKYITPQSEFNSRDKGLKTARGWYSIDPGGDSVNIKSPDFVHSGITGELLAHELTHAAVAHTIADWEEGKKLSPENKAIIDDLNGLYNIVKDGTQNGEFKEALKDLHEFISWGMTNPAFQKHMAGIQVEGQIVENTTGRFQEMATALKRFVKLLVDLVLPNTKKNAETRTALELTIHNTFQLLGQSARPEGKAQKARRFKMESNDARTFTSAQVLDALGKTQATPHSAKRVEQLQGILSSVVYAVYGAEGPIKAEIANNSPATAEEVYLHAKATGHTPFSSLVSARLQLSHQEEFVLESLEIAIRGSLQNSAVRRKELMSIYDQARKNPDIKAKLSKDEYAAIFSTTGAKGNSADYLSRFAAAAMVYSPLTQILNDQKKAIDSRTRRGMNLAESLKLFIDKMVAYLNRLMTRTYAGESASVSIIRMVTDLATAENRRKSAIYSSRSPISDLADATGEKLATAVREGIKKTTESAFFTKSGSTLVQTAGMAVNIVASEQVEDFVKALDKVRNRMVTGRLGIGMDLVNEAKGETEENSWRYQLLNAADAAQRSVMKTLDNTATLVKNRFLRKMSEQESSSLTDVFVRTDAQALLGLYDLSQIEQMLTDPALLEKEILNTVNAFKGVAGNRDIDYYLTSAKALAYHMATNKVIVPSLMMNTHNIAFKANTKSKLSRSRAVYGDSVATALEPLISLYALKYTPMPVRQIGSQILRDEINREDKGNGVELLLLLHREMQVSAKKHLFDGNPVSMIKGYIKDINDPYIDVIGEDAAKHDYMIDSGYEMVGKLDKAANDFTLENRNLYRIKDRALAETVSGSLSTAAKKSRGHALNSGSQVNIVDGEVNPFAKIMNKKSTDKIDAGIAAMFKNGEAFDPTKVKETYTVPIIDHKGDAVNYRYMMSLDTKRALLNPTNQVDKIMGTIAASTLNKVQTPITNKRGIDAIYEEYQQKFAKEPNAFIQFGPESPDPEIRDRYNTLPDEAKAYIRQKFGTDTIRIHNQSYSMMFGYRKFTLASLFDTIPEERDLMTKLFVGLAENLIPTIRNGKVVPLGKQAALRMSQGGAMWDEAVKIIKDALVIKTGFTLMGNELSNASVLMLVGAPVNYIAKKKVEAYGFTMDYLEHERELFHLNQQLAIGTNTVLDMDKKPITADAARQRIIQLNTEIENSPVKDLMDDGMYSTLVEDISQEEDPYSYSSKLARWSDEKTAKLPPWVKSGAKRLFLTHDTTLYKVMNKATTFSDFTSRYVMYEYLTKEAKKPMSKEAALREARKAFVSYNVPTHKGIQYANDKGLLWFTKYYVRIQTVIVQLVKRNPARAVGVLALGDYVFNVSDILDSSVVDHWPVNVGSGALQLPEAVAEILPVNALTEILGIGE